MTTDALTEGLDLDFRPDTYWVGEDENEREELNKHSAHGDPIAGDGALDAYARIGQLTGCEEYLPKHFPGEVEIARVKLASTTWDVISLRARQDGDVISYRVVDEYDSENEGFLRTSKEPLTLGEFIAWIDESPDDSGWGRGLFDPLWNCNLEYGATLGEMEGFIEIESAYYPQIHTWFGRKVDAFLAAYASVDERDDDE